MYGIVLWFVLSVVLCIVLYVFYVSCVSSWIVWYGVLLRSMYCVVF